MHLLSKSQVLGFRSQCSTMTLVQTLAIVLGLEKKKIKTPNNKMPQDGAFYITIIDEISKA